MKNAARQKNVSSMQKSQKKKQAHSPGKKKNAAHMDTQSAIQ